MRPPSGPSAWAKKSNGVVKSARASQPARRAWAAAKRGSLGAAAQGAPQMALAAMGQREQRLLVEADQRRFQQAGEVEVVLWQQDETRQSEQILDGELLAEIEPVDTRDVDVLALELRAPAPSRRRCAGAPEP
jgi:hypothetical protein